VRGQIGEEEYKYVYPSTDKYRMNIGRIELDGKVRGNRRWIRRGEIRRKRIGEEKEEKRRR
jgi:hypothetical protein